MRATRSGRRPRSGAAWRRSSRASSATCSSRRRARCCGTRARFEFSRFAAAEGVDAPRRVAYGLNENHEIELLLGLDSSPRGPASRAVARWRNSSCTTSTATLAWVDAWPRSERDPPLPQAVRLRLVLASGEELVRVFCAPMMKSGQRGVAVVLAMGVVALAAIAAAAMLASQSTWSRHAELGAEHVQAQALVQAGVDWARALLSDDRRVSSVDHLGEPWALRLPPVPVDNGELAGQIDDQQGAFNLNNLFSERQAQPAASPAVAPAARDPGLAGRARRLLSRG